MYRRRWTRLCPPSRALRLQSNSILPQTREKRTLRGIYLHAYCSPQIHEPGSITLNCLFVIPQQRLKTQLHNLSVPFTDDFTTSLSTTSLVVDAIFGFSFGGPLREPYPAIISQLESTKVPVVSVDAPSSWDIESGPPQEGPGANFMPEVLVSLTAPKPCVKFFKGRHFIGGRFLTKATAEKYGLDVPDYPGIDQVMEIGVEGSEKL